MSTCQKKAAATQYPQKALKVSAKARDALPHGDHGAVRTSTDRWECPEEQFAIYIDETWPGSQDHRYKDIGVIGGVVVPWDGISRRLPTIRTHLNTGAAKAAIRTMLAAKDVLPFVFPIKLDASAGGNYFLLVQHAIMLLLGWIIPRSDRPRTVNIYLERFGTFREGHSETDFFRTLKTAIDLLSDNPRFRDLTVGKVEWTGKNFAYVPYGDLVCKTCVPLPDQQNLAREVRVGDWPGYVPFTPRLLPILQEMDNASPAGYADHLISFAAVCHGTALFRHVFTDAVARARKEPRRLDAILERIESCYTVENRDTGLLNRIFAAFVAKFDVSELKARPATLMLRILIGLQHANRNGDPDLANALVTEYLSIRERLIRNDRAICGEIDTNVIAHLHDLFDFDKAREVSEMWIGDPLFPALPAHLRGKLLSRHGQTLAMLGRHAKADDAFNRALMIFSEEPELFKTDLIKTGCLHVLNLLDLNRSQALVKVGSLCGGTLRELAAAPQRLTVNPFHEHLFLKALWRNKNRVQDVLRLYCSHSDSWAPAKDYHPYELILFYRTLILLETDPVKARTTAALLTALFERMEYGGVIGLLRSYMRVELKRRGIVCATDARFKEELDVVSVYLPAAASRTTTLRDAWNDARVDIANLLPFNYV